MTNQKLQAFNNSQPTFISKRYFQPISLTELYAFFGFMIKIGALRLCCEPLSNIYCEDINKCRPIFKAVMPRDRFKNILRFLTFDDEATRTERRKSDKLAPIIYVIETIKDHLLANYSPVKWHTIDEHLCRYTERCSFKQFIPSKPDRYGIKIFILADSLNYYPGNFEIYSGRQQLNRTEV